MPIAKEKVGNWWESHTMDYYAVIKKNDLESCVLVQFPGSIIE